MAKRVVALRAGDIARSGANPPDSDDVRQAMEKLKSLRDGDRGVIELAGCGERALPALRAFLFQREPSGLYQPRCRAVDALAALGAHDVLIEFLSTPSDIADPVERTGEEAVINAAARALIGSHDEKVFALLLDISRRRHLMGVIEALGTFRRIEALPRLVDALGEDCSRPAAEAALLRYGPAARTLLLRTATGRSSRDDQTVSGLRQRRSALRLLAAIGVPRRAWPEMRWLTLDPDPEVAVLAGAIGFKSAPMPEKFETVRRLIGLLPEVEWRLEREIEDSLAEWPDLAAKIVEESLRANGLTTVEEHSKAKAVRALRRVNARIIAKRNPVAKV